MGEPTLEGLLALDVSDPSTPVKVSQLKQGFAPVVAANGNAVYTAAENIRLLNASDPAHLTLSASVASSAYAPNLKVVGSVLIASSNDGLHAYNAGLAGNLALLGSYPGTGISLMAAGDQRVFVGNGPGFTDLEVVDLRAPAVLRRADIRSTGRSLMDIFGKGDRVFSISANALQIWDTTLGPEVVVNLPNLQVFRDNAGDVIVRWPSTFADFVLYSSIDLNPPWQLVTANPGLDGLNFSVTNRFPAGTSKFYRLSK